MATVQAVHLIMDTDTDVGITDTVISKDVNLAETKVIVTGTE
jgi:hypothetical protein